VVAELSRESKVVAIRRLASERLRVLTSCSRAFQMAQAKLRGTTFEIQATANDTVFSYANKPLKFNGDLQYKSGVAYVSLVSKLGLVDQAIASETQFKHFQEKQQIPCYNLI
jgi:hypothetical protein